MKELTYVYGDDCAVCHTMMPHVKKWCDKNKVNFVAMKYADSWLELTSIPTAIYDNWEDTEILDTNGIVNLVSNQYKDGSDN